MRMGRMGRMGEEDGEDGEDGEESYLWVQHLESYQELEDEIMYPVEIQRPASSPRPPMISPHSSSLCQDTQRE